MQLQFRKWVNEFGGIGKLSNKLNVSEHAIRIWLRGDGSPSAKLMLEILVLSKGKLSFEVIHKETIRNKK